MGHAPSTARPANRPPTGRSPQHPHPPLGDPGSQPAGSANADRAYAGPGERGVPANAGSRRTRGPGQRGPGQRGPAVPPKAATASSGPSRDRWRPSRVRGGHDRRSRRTPLADARCHLRRWSRFPPSKRDNARRAPHRDGSCPGDQDDPRRVGGSPSSGPRPPSASTAGRGSLVHGTRAYARTGRPSFRARGTAARATAGRPPFGAHDPWHGPARRAGPPARPRQRPGSGPAAPARAAVRRA